MFFILKLESNLIKGARRTKTYLPLLLELKHNANSKICLKKRTKSLKRKYFERSCLSNHKKCNYEHFSAAPCFLVDDSGNCKDDE